MLRRTLLAILVLFVVAELVLLFPKDLRRDEGTAVEALSVESTQGSDQIMLGVHLYESSDQKKEWELWSDEAKSLKKKNLWDLDQVKVLFFAEDGNEFTVTGKKGLVHVVTKDLKIFGNVLMVSKNGYQFFTDEAYYKAGSRWLEAPKPIKMKGPPDEKGQVMDLEGSQMNASLNSSVMNVIGRVQAHQILEDGKVAKITSDRARFFGDSRKAEFFDNVIIDYDTMRITGPEAHFLYDSETKTMKSLFVRGGARMSDDSKWAVSDQLNVRFAEREYRLTGAPRVIQNDDELTGSEIVFFDGGERIQVRSGEALVDEDRVGSQ